MFTTANGLIIRQMALEYTIIRRALAMKANGKTTNSTEREWRTGQKVPSMRVSTAWD